MTREDVIGWLEYLSDDARSKADGLIPTNIEIACCMAIDALKAQEPRLVTEADFENADEYGFIPVWCEVMGNTSDPFVIKDYWNCIPIDALETAKEDGYRYWTSKPSLKQMKETPWA